MPVPVTTHDDQGSTLLPQVVHLVRQWLVPLLVLALLAGALVGAWTASQPRTHVSSVSFVVQTNTGATDAETLTRTVTALVVSEAVADGLIEASGLDLTSEQVLRRLSVERPPGAGVFRVEVADTDPAVSQALANELEPVFLQRVAELSTPQPGAVTVGYSIRPWAAGAVSTASQDAPVTRNSVLGVVLGGLLGLALVALRALRSPTLLDPVQARAAYGLPVLGALPDEERGGPDPLDSLWALLREGQRAGWPESPRRLLVVGSPAVRDRGVLLVDLAVAVRSEGLVALVDATGGSGSLTSLLSLSDKPGLTDALAGARGGRGGRNGKPPAATPTEPIGSADAPAGVVDGAQVRVVPYGGTTPERHDGALLPGVLDRIGADLDVVDVERLSGPMTWSALLGTVDAVLVVATLGRTPAREAREVGAALVGLTSRPAFVLLLGADRLLVGDRGTGASLPGEQVPGDETSEAPAAVETATGEPATAPPAPGDPGPSVGGVTAPGTTGTDGDRPDTPVADEAEQLDAEGSPDPLTAPRESLPGLLRGPLRRS